MKKLMKMVRKGAIFLLGVTLAVAVLPEVVPFAGNTIANAETADLKIVHVSGSGSLDKALAAADATMIILDDSFNYYLFGVADDDTVPALATENKVNGKKVLDLNGHTINLVRGPRWGGAGAFLLNKGSDLTIIDSDGDGCIKFDEANTSAHNSRSLVRGYRNDMFRALGDNVKLTINGGTFICDYSFNRYVDTVYDYKNPDADDGADTLALMSYWNLWSGCLLYNLDCKNVTVCINGGSFETASQSATLQENPFLAYDENGRPTEKNMRATSLFMNDNPSGTMSVTINDGNFLSKNGSGISDGNVSLQLKGGKYKFERYNKLLSGITAIETEKTYRNTSGEFSTFTPVHNGRIGKLPSADQIAFADDVVFAMEFKGEKFVPVSYSQYKNLSDNANGRYNDSVTFQLTPTKKTDVNPRFFLNGEEVDISENTIRNALIYLPGREMQLQWQLSNHFNPDVILADSTGVEHISNPIVWLTEINAEGLPDKTARVFLTDGCIDLDSLTSSKWDYSDTNISFQPGCTYYFSFSGTESYEDYYEYEIAHKPSLDRVYFRVPADTKAVDSVKLYMTNMKYAGTNTIQPDVNKSVYSVEFDPKSSNIEVTKTEVSHTYAEDVLYPGCKYRYTITLQTTDRRMFNDDTQYTIPGVEDITAVISPFGNQVKLSFDLYTACDHTSKEYYASYTKVDTLYHTCDACGKKLVHSYSEWSQVTTKFVRTCTLCGQRDTAPLGGTVTQLKISPSEYLSGVAVGQAITVPKDIQVLYGEKEYAPSFNTSEMKWYRYRDSAYPEYVDTNKLIEVKEGELFAHERYLLKYKFTLPNVSNSGFTTDTLVGFGARNNSITETAGRRIKLENLFSFGDNRLTGYRTISGYLIVEPIEYLAGSFTLPKISAGDTLSNLFNETWRTNGALNLYSWSNPSLQTSMAVSVTEVDGSQYGTWAGMVGYDPAENPDVTVVQDCTFESGKIYQVTYNINTPAISTYGPTQIYDYTVIPNENGNYTAYEVNQTNSGVVITATYEPANANALKVVEFDITEPAYGNTIDFTAQGIEGLATYTVEIEKIDPKTKAVLVSSADLRGERYEHGTYLFRVKMYTTGGQWLLPEMRNENATFNGEIVDLYERQYLTTGSGGAKGRYYFVFEKAYTVDHSWVIDSQTEVACEMDAVANYHCIYCGETKEVMIAKRLGHDNVVRKKATPAYCDMVGSSEDYYLCKTCGKTFHDEKALQPFPEVWIPVNPNNHQYSWYAYDRDTHWRICTSCKKVVSKPVEHKWIETYDEDEDGNEVGTGLYCENCYIYADRKFSVTVIGGTVRDINGEEVAFTEFPMNGGSPLSLTPNVAEDEIFLEWESTTPYNTFYPDSGSMYLESRESPVTITAKTKKSPCGENHFYRVEYDKSRIKYHYICRNCGKEVIKPSRIYYYGMDDGIDIIGINHSFDGHIRTDIYLDIPKRYWNENAAVELYMAGGNQTILFRDLKKDILNGDEYYKITIESPLPDWNERISMMIVDEYKAVIQTHYHDYWYRIYNINLINDYRTISQTISTPDHTRAIAASAATYMQRAYHYFKEDRTGEDTIVSTEDQRLVMAKDLEGYAEVVNGEAEGLDYLGISLLLEKNIDMRFYFAAESAAGCQFVLDGQPVTPVGHGDNVCYVEISNISAADLAIEHTLTGTDASGNTITVQASVLSYIYKALGSDDLPLQKVVRGLYGYYKALVP